MTIELRANPTGTLRPFLEVVDRAFGEEVDERDLPNRERIYELDRLLAAMDGERIIGGAAAFSFRLSVPGGELPAAGVTAVGVLPTHRRRGILRSLMARQLADVHERGEPLAILYASEGSIYQRYGYGLATLAGHIEIDRQRTAFRDRQPVEGEVRLLDTPEARTELPPIFDAIRASQPGFYARTEPWWESETFDDPDHHRHGYSRRSFGLFAADGAVEGYVTYRVKADWDAGGPNGKLVVIELMARTPRAYRGLWQYAFGVDLMGRIEGVMLPSRPPLLNLMAEPRRLLLTVMEGLWLRVVDLPAALAGRGYPVDGAIVLDVADAGCPWNAGRWLLEASGGHGHVARTRRAADLVLDVADLGSIYLGGFAPSELARAGRVSEPAAGALRRADALFASGIEPWCSQIF